MFKFIHFYSPSGGGMLEESLINSDRNFCEIEFVRFLIEKLAIAIAIDYFYIEKTEQFYLSRNSTRLNQKFPESMSEKTILCSFFPLISNHFN